MASATGLTGISYPFEDSDFAITLGDQPRNSSKLLKLQGPPVSRSDRIGLNQSESLIVPRSVLLSRSFAHLTST